MNGTAPTGSIAVSAAAGTDVGCVRDSNEDAVLIGDLDAHAMWAAAGEFDVLNVNDADASDSVARGARGPLLLVADGMGGPAGGEIAAAIAVQTVWRDVGADSATEDHEVFARSLRRAVRRANVLVHKSARDRGLRGMGTTLSVAGIAGIHLVIANVGDSRAYVWRRGELTQVTRDQSLVSVLLAAGQVRAEDVANSPQSGAILQALGPSADVDPSLSIIELRRGDRILMCSDGLHGLITAQEIESILSNASSPAEGCAALITAARTAGGSDNVTTIVAIVDGDRFELPRDEHDRPVFREFDPHEEGDAALAETSTVVRRLAARIGIGDDPGPRRIPNTGQHTSLAQSVSMPPAKKPSAITIDSVVASPGVASRTATPTGSRWLARVAWLALIAATAGFAWWLAG